MNQARAPFHLLVKPTGAVCNLNCDYCFYLTKRSLYPDEKSFKMTEDVLANLTKQYIEAQPDSTPEINFGWQGGEPTLMGVDFFRKAIALQKKYARPGLRVTNGLQTNGVLLDEEWAEFLHQEHFLVGLSIDGPETLHNTFRRDKRGRGSFAAVMKGLESLRKHKVEFNTLTVVQRNNADHAAEVYDFLKSIGSTFLQFIPIVEPIGHGLAGERSVQPEQYGQFMNKIFDRWLKKDVGKIFVQKFDVMLGVVMGYPASLCVHSDVCGRSVALEHNGDLYSCDHFADPDHYLGNITDSSLAEMVDAKTQSEFGTNKSEALPNVCRKCKFLRYCYGACPKDRILDAAPAGSKLNFLCAGYQSFYRHSLPVFEKMAVCLRASRPARDYQLVNSDGSIANQSPASQKKKPGRNDPCPCGSGLKYKRCCMGNA